MATRIERRCGGYLGLQHWKSYLPRIDKEGIWIWLPIYSWGFQRLFTKPKICHNCSRQWFWYGIRITQMKQEKNFTPGWNKL